MSNEKLSITKTVSLNKVEIDYLQMLINADYKMRTDANVHAIAYGVDYFDDTLNTACGILYKISEADYIR